MPYDLQNLQITNVARCEKSMIARMLQLCLHDLSEFAKAGEPYGDVEGDGAFRYDHLDGYWSDSGREPLLFRIDGRIAGFALVNQWSASGLGTDRSMAEFFILRKYRRVGLGKYAAVEIIRQRPGRWEIPIADYNRPALIFWRSIVSTMEDFSHEKISGDGQRWSGTIWRLTPNIRSR